VSRDSESRELDRVEVLGRLPAEERTEPFLPVVTHRLRNHYTDGTDSGEYLCEVVLPRWVDAVAVLLYCREGGRVRVALKECLRPAVYCRRDLDLPVPDPDRSPFLLEIVAGRLEPGDRGWEGIARRAAEEALEEAGFEVAPASVRELGPGYFTTPGTCPERVYTVAAEVDPSARRPVRGDGSPMEEVGAVRFVDLDEAVALCRSGAIEDAKTEIALLRFRESL
jgi:8-oxo-dGTP pyrophosphatase MutT (NUDIX family)